MPSMPRPPLVRVLAAFCWCTLLAVGCLSLTVVLLQPPRLNYPMWFSVATFFVAQSVATLLWLAGALHGNWTRRVLMAAGAIMAAVGARWVFETIASAHFEGYALMLGSWVAMQGAITVVSGPATRSLPQGS